MSHLVTDSWLSKAWLYIFQLVIIVNVVHPNHHASCEVAHYMGRQPDSLLSFLLSSFNIKKALRIHYLDQKREVLLVLLWAR